MGDVESARARLAELLRHPEDLDKIPALKAEFTRKKSSIDASLRHGLKSQLEITQAGMSNIVDGQRTVNQIKEEMMKIDKLCFEAQNMIRDFPHINLVAQTHRNFELVKQMKGDIDSFPERLEQLEFLLARDDEDPANQPNLLEIHAGLSDLREIRDKAMEQIKGSEDASMELVENLTLESGATVADYFARLDDVVEWFDKHIGEACINLIELVQSGNDGMVVRLALVIQEEEKNDRRAKALQDAQREYSDLASRFKSIATGPKELRGYKEKFLKAIEYVCEANFEQVKDRFEDDPAKLEKSFKWFFNNLNVVKLGMTPLMPKKWHIFRTFTDIYHKQMHDWLLAQIDDEGLRPPQMLAIISWADKYYEKMTKLGVPQENLTPHVIDNRAPDLVREYRQTIVRAVEEWMDRMSSNDKQHFIDRSSDALETDENGIFRTKTLGDSWRILTENLEVAASSERTDVVEGVAEAMFRVLFSRQRMWTTLVETEVARYASPTVDLEGLQALQDYIIAIANDQINCIADDDEERPSYLQLFNNTLAPLVSQDFAETTMFQQIERLREDYLSLVITCIDAFVSLIFATDFKAILPEFFTQKWYSERRMSAITTTYSDYLADYLPVLHPGLRELLLTGLSDHLLSSYLSSVHNKGAKFRRTDPFTDKIKDDVMAVFQFFEQYDGDVSFADIKQKWRAVSEMVKLLECGKAAVASVYEEIKSQYWDVQVGWVEAVLRTRDDFERGMANAVKKRAAEMGSAAAGEGRDETIFAKVR